MTGLSAVAGQALVREFTRMLDKSSATVAEQRKGM